MSEKESAKKSEAKLQVHVDPSLDYSYRDLFNVFAGVEGVLIEFGNLHPSAESQATMYNRVVLSLHNAHRLWQALGRSLQELDAKLRDGAGSGQAEGGAEKNRD